MFRAENGLSVPLKLTIASIFHGFSTCNENGISISDLLIATLPVFVMVALVTARFFTGSLSIRTETFILSVSVESPRTSSLVYGGLLLSSFSVNPPGTKIPEYNAADAETRIGEC